MSLSEDSLSLNATQEMEALRAIAFDAEQFIGQHLPVPGAQEIIALSEDHEGVRATLMDVYYKRLKEVLSVAQEWQMQMDDASFLQRLDRMTYERFRREHAEQMSSLRLSLGTISSRKESKEIKIGRDADRLLERAGLPLNGKNKNGRAEKHEQQEEGEYRKLIHAIQELHTGVVSLARQEDEQRKKFHDLENEYNSRVMPSLLLAPQDAEVLLREWQEKVITPLMPEAFMEMRDQLFQRESNAAKRVAEKRKRTQAMIAMILLGIGSLSIETIRTLRTPKVSLKKTEVETISAPNFAVMTPRTQASKEEIDVFAHIPQKLERLSYAADIQGDENVAQTRFYLDSEITRLMNRLLDVAPGNRNIVGDILRLKDMWTNHTVWVHCNPESIYSAVRDQPEMNIVKGDCLIFLYEDHLAPEWLRGKDLISAYQYAGKNVQYPKLAIRKTDFNLQWMALASLLDVLHVHSAWQIFGMKELENDKLVVAYRALQARDAERQSEFLLALNPDIATEVDAVLEKVHASTALELLQVLHTLPFKKLKYIVNATVTDEPLLNEGDDNFLTKATQSLLAHVFIRNTVKEGPLQEEMKQEVFTRIAATPVTPPPPNSAQ